MTNDELRMTNEGQAVTLHEVLLAAKRIGPYVRRTALERSAAFSAELGVEVWLKLECQQRTGSFKLRGALNRLLTLPPEACERGVLTCSAGNHGLGVAEAARVTGIAATVVVPENASPAKVAALRRAGVELIVTGADYDAAEAQAPTLAAARGLTFISPYDDAAVIVGAGTVMLEIAQELPEAGTILVPVGGGGLAAGTGVVARAANPALRVIGVQSEASPAMSAALAAGRLVPVATQPGAITFPLVRDYLDGVVAAPEEAIAAAMRAFLDEQHLIVEGSGAVGLAALQKGRLGGLPEPVVLIVSGGNVATEVIAALLRR
jgi:threonine dehydratase